MEFKDELGNMMQKLESKMYDLKEIEFNAFSKVKTILIIKSANVNIFKELVSKVKAVNPNIFFYVLARTREVKEISSICRENYEIVEVENEGNYDISLLNLQIEYLRSKCIDMVVLLYNNRYGVGYENLEEILVAINENNYYAFNCYGTLYNIEFPIMQMKNHKLYNEICDWFWEYITFIER